MFSVNIIVNSLLILYINTRTCMTEKKNKSPGEATNFGAINCGRKKKSIAGRERIRSGKDSPIFLFRGKG